MLDTLIVDDEKDICEAIAGVMEDAGYSTRSCVNSSEALAAIRQGRPSLAIIDVWLQGSQLDGLGLVEAIKAFDSTIPIIVISGHGGIDTAVAAIKCGAYDFIEKPFQSKHLLHLAERATESERLRSENKLLRERVGHTEELTGTSAVINQLRATIKRVATSNSRIFITGAPGTGKEVAARAIHRWSSHADGNFCVVSAAHLSPDMIDTQLFGVEKKDGSIRAGLLEQAHGGTLYIDEIADIPLATQGKLLRALTENSFFRLGGATPVQSNIRIISSSAQDLKQAIEQQKFREDLYYRLNVVPIHIAALKDRREDIISLCEHFITRFAMERNIAPPQLSSEVVAILQSYDWPGNVRELCNIIERIIILTPKAELQQIGLDVLPKELLSNEDTRKTEYDSMMIAPLKDAREAFEKEYLRIHIRRFSGNVSRTAHFIGMERSALHRKLKLLGLTSQDK